GGLGSCGLGRGRLDWTRPARRRRPPRQRPPSGPGADHLPVTGSRAPSAAVPRADVGGLVDTLRADLADAQYTVPAVQELLGPVASAALHREQAVPALRALRLPESPTPVVVDAGEAAPSASPVATLVRLFLLGRQVRRRELDAALPRTGTDGARRLGLVEPAGHDADDEVRPLVDLRP